MPRLDRIHCHGGKPPRCGPCSHQEHVLERRPNNLPRRTPWQPRSGLPETETATVTGSARAPSGRFLFHGRYTPDSPRCSRRPPRYLLPGCCLPIRPNGPFCQASTSAGLRGCPQGVGCISCEIYPPPSTGSYASMRSSRSPTTTPPSLSHTRLNTPQPINIALSHNRKGHLSTSKPWTN